jgi:hypothetical protein
MGRNEGFGSVRSGLAGGCEQMPIQVRGDADGGMSEALSIAMSAPDEIMSDAAT